MIAHTSKDQRNQQKSAGKREKRCRHNSEKREGRETFYPVCNPSKVPLSCLNFPQEEKKRKLVLNPGKKGGK